MPGPISKGELNALKSIVRDPKTASKTVDEGTLNSLNQRGMVREKLGKTEATTRGKMTVQRSNSVSRGRGRGGGGGRMID